MTRDEAHDLIEEVIEDICNEHCKHPGYASADELDRICDDCLINNLWELERGVEK